MEPDVIIVGAGVVGCPLAVALSDQGRKVVVFERDFSEPDRIVGELMQPAGVEALNSLGLGWTTEGIDAQLVEGYGLLYGGDTLGFKYPELPRTGKRALGVAFHHGRFIMRLREAARKAKNVELRQGIVLDLVHEEPGNPSSRVVGVTYKSNTSGDEVLTQRAPLTIVCDGCHSKFRSKVDADSDVRIDVGSHFVGSVLKNAKLPFDKHGNVYLIKPSPVLMYQIGSNETRVLVDIPGNKLRPKEDIIKYMEDTVAPQLPEQVRGAFLDAVREPDGLRSMPNQYMSAREIFTPGVILLGDASNMRHPLTGGGMTVGLTDVVILKDLLAAVPDFSDANAIDSVRRMLFQRRKAKVSSINVLSLALYEVFSVPNPDFEELRAACFYYLKSGGIWLRGPVGLLSGLQSEPMLLISHFFAVALYGTWRMCFPIPTPWRVWNSMKLITEAANIMLPLLIRDRITFLNPIFRLFYGSCEKAKLQ